MTTPITIEASVNAGYFTINGIDYPKNNYGLKYDNIEGTEAERNFSLCSLIDGSKIIASRGYAEIVGVTSWSELLLLLSSVGALRSNDVSIQDQTTPVVIAAMSYEEASSLLTVALSIGDTDITVTDSTGFVVGGYLSVFSVPDNRFFLASILAVNANVVTVDTPVDFAYPIGAFVTSGTTNMNVDGSVTPVIFGLRNTDEAVGSSFDITRLMFSCATTNIVDLSKFGDIVDGITNGIVLRKKDGVYHNIFNVKRNGELARIMYDWTPYVATNPQQGRNGFVGRLTFAGQSKIGVTIRLAPGEDIQLIVQDDLTSLLNFAIVAEGHIVE